ncbi:MAG: hypothetical protein DMG01_14370 [Acidobacteria bacterium]|nr:MAG: hypothetical protein DMG01_14370 [Acidobacteriota bacterium]
MPRVRASTIHCVSPRARIEDVQRGHPAAFHRVAQHREVRVADRVAHGAVDEAERARAVHVRRVDRRHLEFRLRRLRFLAVAPCDGNGVGAAIAD